MCVFVFFVQRKRDPRPSLMRSVTLCDSFKGSRKLTLRSVVKRPLGPPSFLGQTRLLAHRCLVAKPFEFCGSLNQTRPMSYIRYLLPRNLPSVQVACLAPKSTRTGASVSADVASGAPMIVGEGSCASTLACWCGLLCLTDH